MTQLQEAIRDKITKYSDACGMCTDTTKDCDACYIPCMLDELNELQELANRQESMGPTAHWISVKDRLPDIFDEVLVYDTFSDTSIPIAWRETTQTTPRKNGIVDWYWNSQMSYPEDLTHVTHWMPLPEPPTKGE